MSIPKFKIGFELEGTVREDVVNVTRDRLQTLHSQIELGSDGSVNGCFKEGRWVNGGYVDYVRGYPGEIRTPPLPLEAGLALFDKIVTFLNEQESAGNFFTDKTCGLHVSLSESSMVKSHKRFARFYGLLVTHFPEREVLKMFDRTGNDYCSPLFTVQGQKKADYLEVAALAMINRFGRGKYHSVAIHSGPDSDEMERTVRASDRRVEFRCLGNAGYHKDFEKLHRAIDLILDSALYAYDMVINPPEEDRNAEELADAFDELERETGDCMPEYICCA